MAFKDMDQTEKVKLFAAIGILVVAAGLVTWNFWPEGSAEVTPAPVSAGDSGNATTPAPPPTPRNRAVAPGAPRPEPR